MPKTNTVHIPVAGIQRKHSDTTAFLNKNFVCSSQHDAHEFLIYLLEGLHEDLNRVRLKKKRILDSGNEVEYIR